MKSTKLLKKIKSYAFASFLVPLIAVNSCLAISKFTGKMSSDYSAYPNFEWNKGEFEIAFNDYNLIVNNFEKFTFTNCPKYELETYYTTIDNQIIKHMPKMCIL